MISELKQIVLESFPGFLIDSAYDYGDIVVFNLFPKDYTTNNLENVRLDSSFSINKKTKEIRAFLPFDIPTEVYKNGKKVM